MAGMQVAQANDPVQRKVTEAGVISLEMLNQFVVVSAILDPVRKNLVKVASSHEWSKAPHHVCKSELREIGVLTECRGSGGRAFDISSAHGS